MKTVRSRSATLGASALLTVAVAVGAGATSGQAAYPGVNGRLACEGTRQGSTPPPAVGSSEVFTVNPDGSGEILLTDNTVRDGDPSFSPDGKNIAFESFRGLDAANANSSEVYRMGADGSNPVRLTTNGTPEDRSTSWSPDGTKIVFHSSRDTLPAGAPAGSSRFEIYTMNADGTNQTRITNNTFQDTLPAWSPDGQRIAFLSTRDGDIEIYTTKPDGTDVVRVTNSPGEDAHPGWSPDGKQLTFHSRRTGSLDIFRQNADGSGVATRVTTNPVESEYFPIWSPDGKRIAFNGTVPGDSSNVDVYTVDAVDGSDLTRVTTAPGFDGRCDWQTLPPVTPPPSTTTTPTPAPPTPAPPAPLAPLPAPPPIQLPPAARDTAPPSVRLSGVASSMSLRSFLRGVRAKVSVSEAASLDGTLEASAGRATFVAGFNLSLATKSAVRRTGTRTLVLKPSRSLVGRARTFRARVRVVATDAAGNRRTVTKSIRVKR